MFWTATGSGFRISISAESATTWAIMSRPVPLWKKAQENGGAEAASLLGQTYEALGDYNYAASVYNTYLQNKTPDASLYNQLGLCKLKGGDYEAACSVPGGGWK